MSNAQSAKRRKKLEEELPTPSPVIVPPPASATSSLLSPAQPPVKRDAPKMIRLKNNLKQMVPMNIRNEKGVAVGIEIPAYGERMWPDVDLGPDVAVKVGKKYISILR